MSEKQCSRATGVAAILYSTVDILYSTAEEGCIYRVEEQLSAIFSNTFQLHSNFFCTFPFRATREYIVALLERMRDKHTST